MERRTYNRKEKMAKKRKRRLNGKRADEVHTVKK